MPTATAAAREKRRPTEPRNTPRKRKGRKTRGFLAVWWPLLLGVAATPFAIHTASIMALAGPSALITLYPWVLLVKSPVLGVANGFGENLSQLLMYLQFPLYGLLMSLVLRARNLWMALASAATAHFAAVFILFLMARAHIQ